MMDSADLLTVPEVAALMRVTRQAVDKWIKAGHLPALKIAGTVRVRRADLEAALKPMGVGR